MSAGWGQTSQQEAFKRAAGRRKLHIRRRTARAERIKGLLSDMLGAEPEGAEMLRSGAYGATRMAAQGFGMSEATASRDLALCHRLLEEFRGLFGRELSLTLGDEVVWSWDYSHYSFRAFGRKETVGQFPCTTRA